MNGNVYTNLPSIETAGVDAISVDPTTWLQIKADIHRRLLETLDLVEAKRMPMEKLHEECSRRINSLLEAQRCPLTGPEKSRLIREIMDEVFGLGPIEELLRDPTISDILVNGSDRVYVERHGKLEKADIAFRNEEHLMLVIQRIAANVGRRIDEGYPMLDARLGDGTRVNAIIPPLALDGASMSLRRFQNMPIDAETLSELGSWTPEIAAFLKACVQSRMNILIAGGTGSGKTTLLNVLSQWIPDGERIVTIEDTAELQLQQEHIVRLETRPPNIEGMGEVTQRDLLKNTLRMRPDRIIIGEVRGSETFDMLQAMNTGHEGSMTTIHANNPRDAMRRVENMVTMAGLNFPIHTIRQQMASALDLVVHQSRLTGGRRKLQAVAEVTGIEGDMICMQNLFRFNQTGVDANGHAQGSFEACGIRPRLLDRLTAEGQNLPAEMFQRHTIRATAPGS